jgi:hypothetical protein
LRGNIQQLEENERFIEWMLASGHQVSRESAVHVMTSLLSSPHTTSLVDLVAAAYMQDTTTEFFGEWPSNFILSLPVRETLFRHFRGEDVTLYEELDEATMRMIVRTADAKPHVKSITLGGCQGCPLQTIAELGQTTTLTSVSLTIKTTAAMMHDESLAVSKVALNASMAEAICHNNTIQELDLHGDFDTFVCSGILNTNTALDSLHIHMTAGQGGGGGLGDLSDNLEQVKLMLMRNTALQDLSLEGDFPLTEAAATSLADGLKANTRLMALHCKFPHVDAKGYNALIHVMANDNTTLEYFSGLGDELEYYCALNRAGRRVLRRQDTNHDTFLEVLHGSIDNLTGIYGLLLDIPPNRWFS